VRLSQAHLRPQQKRIGGELLQSALVFEYQRHSVVVAEAMQAAARAEPEKGVLEQAEAAQLNRADLRKGGMNLSTKLLSAKLPLS
jgi:hypothetical protein